MQLGLVRSSVNREACSKGATMTMVSVVIVEVTTSGGKKEGRSLTAAKVGTTPNAVQGCGT